MVNLNTNRLPKPVIDQIKDYNPEPLIGLNDIFEPDENNTFDKNESLEDFKKRYAKEEVEKRAKKIESDIALNKELYDRGVSLSTIKEKTSPAGK